MCEVDHVAGWNVDGGTDQSNAGVRCGGHNRLKHARRFTARRDGHGQVFTIRADGTVILPVGARPPNFPDYDGPEPDARTRAA